MANVFLIGYMGSGKTSLGKIAAERLSMQFIDLDEYIETKMSMNVSAIFSNLGEEKFREIEKESLAEVARLKNTIIATGGGAPCYFDNIEVMNFQGTTIYIKLSAPELAIRLKATNLDERPLLANLSAGELEEFIIKALKERAVFYSQAKHKVSGTDDEIVEKIVAIVRGERGRKNEAE